jgi:hypothetical protein
MVFELLLLPGSEGFQDVLVILGKERQAMIFHRV